MFRETENDLSLVECNRPDNNCAITPVCKLKTMLDEARQAFLTTLDQYTLADLVKPGTRPGLQRILHIS